MKRVNLFVIALITLLLLSGQAAVAQQPVFRIGVLDDQAGSLSKGAQLAVQQLNAAGGVRGADGTFFQLQLIVQPTNDGSNLANAVANLNQADIIAALGPATTNEVSTGFPQLQSLNVPVLTPATGDNLLVTDTTDRLFRSRAAQILQGQALALYLVNDQNLRSIAVVQLDVESTDNVLGFSNALQMLGVTPQMLLLQGQVNDLATSIVQSNPQVAVIYGNMQLASQLLITLRQVGWGGLVGYDQAADPNFGVLTPSNMRDGILSTATWSFAATDASSMLSSPSPPRPMTR